MIAETSGLVERGLSGGSGMVKAGLSASGML
jgi:hypothetical protein